MAALATGLFETIGKVCTSLSALGYQRLLFYHWYPGLMFVLAVSYLVSYRLISADVQPDIVITLGFLTQWKWSLTWQELISLYSRYCVNIYISLCSTKNALHYNRTLNAQHIMPYVYIITLHLKPWTECPTLKVQHRTSNPKCPTCDRALIVWGLHNVILTVCVLSALFNISWFLYTNRITIRWPTLHYTLHSSQHW